MNRIHSFLNRIPHKRAILFFAAVLFFVALSTSISFQIRNKNEPVKLGVSFSTKYAEELGLDWQQTYLALLDDIEVKNFRLMSYWDTIEPEDNQFTFDDLDWQIQQAEAHDATVSLAVGMRQPRWPECHMPEWAKQLDEQAYETQLMAFLTKVVDRYKDSPSVISYQVENEAANALFGDCPSYNPDLLTREIELVKKLDPEATVITNVSNQSGTPLFDGVSKADKVGFSIYKKAHFDAFNRKNSWSFWYVPSQWHSLRAAVVEGVKGKEVFVHELQAEPWGPEATVNLSDEEQSKTMDPEQLKTIVEFAKQTGMKEIDLWGGEWWYWRLTEFNDRELWDTVKDIYSESI